MKEGTIDVDQSALTGESLPVTLQGGDAAQMGATVVRGETHATGGDALSGRSPCLLHVCAPSTDASHALGQLGSDMQRMYPCLMFPCSGMWTGESPLSMVTVMFPVSSSMGLNGALDAHAVEQTGKNTFFGRTATLLQSVENLGNLQRILMRVVIVLLVSISPFVGSTPLCCSYSVHTRSVCSYYSLPVRSVRVMVHSQANCCDAA